jgi:hypothetical protein
MHGSGRVPTNSCSPLASASCAHLLLNSSGSRTSSWPRSRAGCGRERQVAHHCSGDDAGKRELRNSDAALAVLDHSLSAVEQYHAMLPAAAMIKTLTLLSDAGLVGREAIKHQPRHETPAVIAPVRSSLHLKDGLAADSAAAAAHGELISAYRPTARSRMAPPGGHGSVMSDSRSWSHLARRGRTSRLARP